MKEDEVRKILNPDCAVPEDCEMKRTSLEYAHSSCSRCKNKASQICNLANKVELPLLMTIQEMDAIFDKWKEWDKVPFSKIKSFDTLMETIAQAQLDKCLKAIGSSQVCSRCNSTGLISDLGRTAGDCPVCRPYQDEP